MSPSQEKEKNFTNYFLNTNSTGWEFKWEKKYWLVVIIGVCALLLIFGSQVFLSYLPNLAVIASGFHALNFLITLTK